MTTQALDLATILKAFLQLEEKGFKPSYWKTSNDKQQRILDLLDPWERDIQRLQDLDCEVKIQGALQIAVTAILDKTVFWLDGVADKAVIDCDGKKFPGFKLKDGCSVHEIGGYSEPLLLIETKSGDLLHLMPFKQELVGLDLVEKVLGIIGMDKGHHPEYASKVNAKVPQIDFNLRPEISFLCGMCNQRRDGDWVIGSAKQEFRFRMNRCGAHAFVRTEMILLGSSVGPDFHKTEFVLDSLFLGWITEKGNCFPLAIFWADTDCWKETENLN